MAGTAWIHDFDIQRAEKNQLPKGKKKKDKKKNCKAIPETPTTAGTHQARNEFQNQPEGLRRSNSQWRSSAFPSRPQMQLSTLELLQYLQDHPHKYFARKARFFLLSIALCHTCLPERDEEGEIVFQAASPDELALVRAARELGYIVVDREIDAVYVQTYPNGPDGGSVTERYEILDVIEFSSSRKRMSVIVRLPNGEICIFCKGADTTIMQLLRLGALARQQATEVERKAGLRRSIEAQEIIRRNSSHRQSIGGTNRNSMTLNRDSMNMNRNSIILNRLQPISDEMNEFLRDREEDVGKSSIDGNIPQSSRPSGQYTASAGPASNGHSIAVGESSRARDRSDDLVDETLAMDEERVFGRCFGHINDFASEGLRTLLYGYRYIDEQEYAVWKKLYAEATTSLVNRQELIEQAAEMIERDFELGGGTAIEDKLQKGVPSAIDKLRRAGIKLWMLTGDKRGKSQK